MNKILQANTEDGTFCKCAFCSKTIAEFKNDIMNPTAEECYAKGNVAVPNFGWFCSQKCTIDYEVKFDVKFSRTTEGKIDYYTSN